MNGFLEISWRMLIPLNFAFDLLSGNELPGGQRNLSRSDDKPEEHVTAFVYNGCRYQRPLSARVACKEFFGLPNGSLTQFLWMF